MATKNQLSLGNILENFKKAQEGSEEVTKTAAAAVVDKATEKVTDEGTTKTATQKENKDTADVSALKKIAEDAVAKEGKLMEKEAEEFGTLFAHSFMQELEKTAQVEEVYKGAYQATTQAFENAALQEKLAEVQDEAYYNTISDIAGRQTYLITQQHLVEKTAGELPLALAGVTQEAYDNTLEALKTFS